MHNNTIAQYLWRIRTSVLYGNKKKFNTEAVKDYPPIRFEIRFERKFPIVGLYFWTLPVETLWNLCPVEKLFGMRMAGLCQFYWRTSSLFILIILLNMLTMDQISVYMRMMQSCSFIKTMEDSAMLQKDLDSLTQWMEIKPGYLVRDPFVETEIGSSFGFSETACFASETETGFANLVKRSPITVSLSKPKKRRRIPFSYMPRNLFFLRISKPILITGFQHCQVLNVSLTWLLNKWVEPASQ